MACSDNKNPLQRDGTSQQERPFAALKSSYVRVDEREYQDWIVFAASFARYLNFYDTDNLIKGNWEPFFTSDISALLGTLAIQDIGDYQQNIQTQISAIQSNSAAANQNTAGQAF